MACGVEGVVAYDSVVVGIKIDPLHGLTGMDCDCKWGEAVFVGHNHLPDGRLLGLGRDVSTQCNGKNDYGFCGQSKRGQHNAVLPFMRVGKPGGSDAARQSRCTEADVKKLSK